MRRALWPLALAAASLGAAGCPLRLSDPVYAFKDVRADEPSHAGKSLIFGSIVVDNWGFGDLDSVSLVTVAPEAARRHVGVNRVNLFRVFFRRAMKDGHFIIEVDPGLYEMERFTTSGWGQPVIWNTRDDARKNTRVLVTRPGIYDMGTIRVARGEGSFREYGVERIKQTTPERQAILARALAGTGWERLLPSGAGPATETDTDATAER